MSDWYFIRKKATLIAQFKTLKKQEDVHVSRDERNTQDDKQGGQYQG